MHAIYWVIGTLTTAALLGLTVIVLLKYFNRPWWRNRWVRRIARGWLLFGVLTVAIWILAYYIDMPQMAKIGSMGAVIMLTVSLGLIISLPLSGLVNRLARPKEKPDQPPAGEKVDPNRRRLLKSAAAVFPLIAAGAAGRGLVDANTETKIELLPLTYKDLPPALEGLKILHLSDSHLGIYKSLDDLERIIERADNFKPDLVLFTGDIADNLRLLPDALKMTASLKPRFGVYASLGNHEYYRGIDGVLKAFEKSEVPLLRHSGISVPVGETSVYIAGADDPVSMGRDHYDFHKKSLDQALDQAASGDFIILMSHRPSAFSVAADIGLDLTLAGHTHGGQIGLGDRSLWSIFAPGSYLRGHYHKGRSQIYVSSGIGHWFPFRLGCPSEAPVIQLAASS
jgi:predicted MPP superfamily phosphohydrolase